MKNFRTFDLAVEFYRITQTLKLKGHLKEQLSRATLSISLNLAEGRGKATVKDQKRFFSIAMGSFRESQAILIIAGLQQSESWELSDKLGAHLYRLIKNSS